MPDLGAIVLAAGGSTRMGRPKQLLSINGKTLVRKTVETGLDAGCDPLVVVLGASADLVSQELRGLNIHTAINPQWTLGIGSSIRTGAQALLTLGLPLRAIALLLCDQPLISASSLQRLFQSHFDSGKAVAVSSYNQTIGPPIVLAPALLPDLLSLPDAQGAKALWMSRPQIVHQVPCPQAATDIDTPEDFQALAKGLGNQ